MGDSLFELLVHHGPGYPLYCLRKADAGVVRMR